MSREINLKVQEKLGSIIADRQVDRLDEVFAQDVVDHDPAPDAAPGVRGIIDFWVEFLTAFPDVELNPEVLMADEDKVTVVLTIAGTHQGPFQGVEPTGRSIRIRGIQVARFEDGLIVERWGCSDEAGIMKQIGAA